MMKNKRPQLQLNVKPISTIKRPQTPILLPLQLPPTPPLTSDTLNDPSSSKNYFVKINGQHYTADEGDFSFVQRLGAGACGTVNEMKHLKSNVRVAIKEMTKSSDPEENKRINMDLEILLKCNNENIVKCFGQFTKGPRVFIVMELMTTCLEKLIKAIKSPFPEDICGKIAVASINALDYLKIHHKIIHRDVKPSNILINKSGEIKLCDFGVSGRLVDSVANTRHGCIAYMSPERIRSDLNKPYDVRADIWSLGITLIQLSTNSFPYLTHSGNFELLTQIIDYDAPSLPKDMYFSDFFREFITGCMEKDVERRPKYNVLKWYPFYLKYKRQKVDIRGWFEKICKAYKLEECS